MQFAQSWRPQSGDTGGGGIVPHHRQSARPPCKLFFLGVPRAATQAAAGICPAIGKASAPVQ
eukprot:5015257-Lingulodinium_polyedra.AAC.1